MNLGNLSGAINDAANWLYTQHHPNSAVSNQQSVNDPFSVDVNNYQNPSYSDYDKTWLWRIFHGKNGRNQIEADYNSALDLRNKQYEQDTLSKAREYELYYDSTKYQRAVNDLRAAGLNPWLAVQSGISGSGTTSASGSSSKATKTNIQQSNSITDVISFLFSAILNTFSTAAKISIASSMMNKSSNNYRINWNNHR